MTIGMNACRHIRKVSPETQVTELSVHTDHELVAQMIRAGAAGYLPKNSSGFDLIEAEGMAIVPVRCESLPPF